MDPIASYEEILDSLSNDQQEDLVHDAKDYIIANGGIMISKMDPKVIEHFPFMLFPTPWPRKLYIQAKEVQKDFNLLVHRVCLDSAFIKEMLESTIQADDFTRQIYKIYDVTRSEGIAQSISLTCLRSDYMIDNMDMRKLEDLQNTNQSIKLSQVELNTIALGCSCISEILSRYGSFILGKIGYDVHVGSPQLPINIPMTGISEGLATAWQFYGCKNAVILMIASETDRYRFDQKPIDHYLHHRQPRIQMITRSLTALANCASLKDNKLMVDGYEVAVAYYLSGYSPNCYPTQNEWDVRLLIERSAAIKCPTAAMQLVGTKKMQQVFAKPGVVERFISDECAVKRIRDTFTGLYTLDQGPEGEETYQMALQRPDKFVLKPQREGGGNNIFGESIKATLESQSPAERAQYILMDKIQSPSTTNYYILPDHDKPIRGEVSSEVGVHGILISCGDKILVNKEIGYFMRTKDVCAQEGETVFGTTAYFF